MIESWLSYLTVWIQVGVHIRNWKAVCFQGKKKKGGQADNWEKGGVGGLWPLVAFTTQAQIIEGHGNWSDRWTMLPFSNPLWTGPSITTGEINSIHQLFVSLGPLIPPDIAHTGLINVFEFDLGLLAWHRLKHCTYYQQDSCCRFECNMEFSQMIFKLSQNI